MRLTKLTEELKRIRKENNFTEVHLNNFKTKIKTIRRTTQQSIKYFNSTIKFFIIY